jgi:transposase
MNFIGLDIHKKTISYCMKDISGKVLSEGKIPATRQGLQEWVGTLGKPWTVAMEATMFTGCIKVEFPESGATECRLVQLVQANRQVI